MGRNRAGVEAGQFTANRGDPRRAVADRRHTGVAGRPLDSRPAGPAPHRVPARMPDIHLARTSGRPCGAGRWEHGRTDADEATGCLRRTPHRCEPGWNRRHGCGPVGVNRVGWQWPGRRPATHGIPGPMLDSRRRKDRLRMELRPDARHPRDRCHASRHGLPVIWSGLR